MATKTFTGKSSISGKGSLDALRSPSSAVVRGLRMVMGGRDLRSSDIADVGQVHLIDELSLLATGCYNSLFLVKLQDSL